MNTKQQVATGLLALLMFATIIFMPATFHSQATYSASVLRQAGPVGPKAEARSEIPQDQVRDLDF